MPLPTFVVIGAPRAGTTSLHRWFGGHPDVCMSRPKESQFFSLHYQQGRVAYERCFSHHAGEPVVGESTPVYLTLPHVPPRIAATLPDVTLVAILREPVQQAHSAWWLLRSMGAERRSFADAVHHEMGRPPLTADDSEVYWRRLLANSEAGRPVDDARYLATGHYLASLQRYHEHVDPERLTVLLHDDLRADPQGSLRRIAEAVGVDVTRGPSPTLPRANRSTGPAEAWARRHTRRVPSARGRKAMWWLAARFDRGGPPSIEPALRAELQDWFARANDGLSDLLGRDLTVWARPSASRS